MHSWRVTKYNPIYRNELGHYKKDEWIAVSDIGDEFDGTVLTAGEYLRVENLYVNAVHEFLEYNKIDRLTVSLLEKWTMRRQRIRPSREMKRIYRSIKNNDEVGISKLPDIISLILRDVIWCRLIYNDTMFVHFGWDYYMYIGSKHRCAKAINNIEKSGLFVEEFESPYLSDEIAEG